MRCALESLLGVHNEMAKLIEKLALQGFGEKVTNHLTSRTILNREFFVFDSIGDEIVPAVQMLGSFTAGLVSILFKENGTLVILIQDCIGGTITLGIKEIVSPKNDWHKIVSSHEFILGGAASVDFLLGGSVNGHTLPKRHATTRMPTHVGVRGMGAVHPPFGNRDGV